MPVCGYLISVAGWASVFYWTGGIGLLWSLCWFFFVYETPATHPRISAEERREIEEAIGTSTSKKRPSYVPWVQLLCSPAVWAIVITHGLAVFGFFLVVNQLPTFMSKILHFDIKEVSYNWVDLYNYYNVYLFHLQNGLFSSLPYLGKYVMAVASSYLADHLRQKGVLSTTATRKIFTTFGRLTCHLQAEIDFNICLYFPSTTALFTPGLLMTALVFLGRDATWAVSLFTLALFAHGAVTAGYLGNGLDIAPNFSGTIFGMANSLSSFGGFLSTWMVGVLTYNNVCLH